MSDYQIKVGVRNGRIVKKMRASGFDSLAQLARAAGCSYQSLVLLVQMKTPAKRQDGMWRSVVLNVCGVLNCLPDELFNDQQATTPLRQTSGEIFVDQHEMVALCGGSTAIADSVEAKLTVQKLLGCLQERERSVVEGLMEGATLDEMGREIGVTRERVRQIERKAHRKMKAWKPTGEDLNQIDIPKPKWSAEPKPPEPPRFMTDDERLDLVLAEGRVLAARLGFDLPS